MAKRPGESSVLILAADTGLTELLGRAVALEGRRGLVARTLAEADLALATVPADAMLVELEIGREGVFRWLDEIRRLRPELTRRTIVLTEEPPDFAEEDALAVCGALPLVLPATVDELRRAVRALTALSEPLGDPDSAASPRPRGRARRAADD